MNLSLRARVSLLLVVLLGACSGGGGAKAPNDTIDPTVRDQLLADASVLQVTDLPDVFRQGTSRPPAGSDASASVSGAAAECFRTDDGRTAFAVREFVNGEELRHTIVRSEVETHADASSLAGKVATFTSTAASNCMKQFIGRLFASEGGVVGDVVAVPSRVDADYDEQAGFVFSIQVLEEDGNFSIGVEILLGRVDRFRATASTVAFDKTPDHSLAVAAMKAMAIRLRQ